MKSYIRNSTRYVSRLSTKIRRQLDELASGEELTGIQSRLIRFVMTQEPGQLCQKDIEAEYSIRPSSASELLSQLEKKGFIVRKENPDNRRQKLIYPTEKAESCKDDIRVGLSQLEENLTKDIPEEKLETCLEVLEMMMKNMEDEKGN